MTSERQIWEAVLLLVRRYGRRAAVVADREASHYDRRDDELGSLVWRRIARRAAELIKPTPDLGERVH
jgi:hypothetical protein